VAAEFPICKYGSPKYYPYPGELGRAGADELKHENSCIWWRQSVEADVEACSTFEYICSEIGDCSLFILSARFVKFS